MTRSDSVYLLHMRDECQRILDFIRDGEDDFREDVKSQYAVMRSLQIIGDAVKKISEDLKKRHENVPWRAIAGMRDKLVHGYFDVDVDAVWLAARDRVPQLLDDVERMIADVERGNA